MEVKTKREELEEAIASANDALYHLDKAYNLLKSAGNWGLWDIFGGGFIVSMIKRNKLSAVAKELSIVRAALGNFEDEMRDIDMTYELDVLSSDLVGALDVFFDNAFIDVVVQSKISLAKRQIQDVKLHIQDQKSLLEGLLRRESI